MGSALQQLKGQAPAASISGIPTASQEALQPPLIDPISTLLMSYVPAALGPTDSQLAVFSDEMARQLAQRMGYTGPGTLERMLFQGTRNLLGNVQATAYGDWLSGSSPTWRKAAPFLGAMRIPTAWIPAAFDDILLPNPTERLPKDIATNLRPLQDLLTTIGGVGLSMIPWEYETSTTKKGKQ